LVWQAGETIEQQWNHTAALLAQLANTVRDSKKKPSPFEPDDFHPVVIARRRRPSPTGQEPKLPVSVLKSIFVDRQ